MELYAQVRLAVVDEGLSHRGAARRFGIDRRTVKKMLSYSAPPGYRRTMPVRRPEAGRVHGGHRRDPVGGPGCAAQAAAHGTTDLRAASGRARLHRRLHHREGLRPRSAAVDTRSLRAAASPAGPCPGRLWPSGGRSAWQAGEGPLLLLYLAPFERLVREGLPAGDDGGFPGRARQRLRLLRRDPSIDPVRQHDAGGGADHGRRRAPPHPGLLASAVALSVPRPLRPARQGQRQREGRGAGEDGAAQVLRADPKGAGPGRPERTADGGLPGASRRPGGRREGNGAAGRPRGFARSTGRPLRGL